MKEGWKEVRLGDVCEIYCGRDYKSVKDENGQYPIYGTGGIMGYANSYICPENTTIVGRKGSINNPIYVEQKFWNIDTAYGFVAKQDLLNPKYLFYFCKLTNFEEYDCGCGRPSLRSEDLLEILIPLPPLPEQQRIVSVLDSAFAKIEQMKRNAEMAILDAQDVFKNTLDDMMEMKEGWEEKRLGEICKIDRGKRFVRNDIVSEGVPCIHYGDIYTYYGLYTYKSKGYISHELAKKMRFAYKNDVVVVQAGENPYDIGVGVAWLGDEPAAVHDACFILRHKQNPLYLSYYLRSSEYHYNLRGYVHEGKICSFLKPALETAIIPLPPLSEQQRIVSVLDDLSANCKQLESNYRHIMADCEELKQAILTRAMNGEL